MADALEVVEQVAGALDAAHRRGVLHRDVKPANILLETSTSGRRAFLADFGIARMLTADQSVATTTLGTVAYSAPEVLSDDAVGVTADVYSLGCVAFECLTGVRRRGGLPAGRHADGVAPPSASAVAPALPRAADAVLLAAASDDPDERPPDVLTFAHELRAACSGSVPTAARTIRSDRLTQVDRHPADDDTPVQPVVEDPAAALTLMRARRTAPSDPPPPAQRRPRSRLLLVGGVVVVAAALTGGALLVGEPPAAVPGDEPVPEPARLVAAAQLTTAEVLPGAQLNLSEAGRQGPPEAVYAWQCNGAEDLVFGTDDVPLASDEKTWFVAAPSEPKSIRVKVDYYADDGAASALENARTHMDFPGPFELQLSDGTLEQYSRRGSLDLAPVPAQDAAEMLVDGYRDYEAISVMRRGPFLYTVVTSGGSEQQTREAQEGVLRQLLRAAPPLPSQ